MNIPYNEKGGPLSLKVTTMIIRSNNERAICALFSRLSTISILLVENLEVRAKKLVIAHPRKLPIPILTKTKTLARGKWGAPRNVEPRTIVYRKLFNYNSTTKCWDKYLMKYLLQER